MADSREIGLRVGAAFNQASNVAAALVQNGRLPDDPTTIATYVDELAGELLTKMNDTQVVETTKASFPGTTVVATPVAAPAYVAPVAAPPAANETTFSGSNKPLKLHEHPELPGWLHAQAAAKGVTEVWDNRGKPNYIAAIQSGAAKTPPPFRSSTAGNDTSFWAPR